MKKNLIVASIILASTTANAQQIQTPRVEIPETKIEYKLKESKMSKGVVKAYKAIENGVVGAYKWIENGVVKGYKKIEDAFIEKFLEEVPDETSEKSE